MEVTYENVAKFMLPRPSQVMELLEEKPMRAEEIAQYLGVKTSSVRFILRQCKGLVKIRIGKMVYYAIEEKVKKAVEQREKEE